MPSAKKKMSDAHKKALAEGRKLGQSVREYLEALDENRPKRGRRRTPDSIQKRLDAIGERLKAARPLERVQLAQERIDLRAELEKLGTKVDLSKLEDRFVKAAKDYAERKGISYAAWREAGVPAEVLKRAGISRGGS
ncbi:MAG TPA: hypothetical protein VI916_15280 [Acidimicrobiia bacterium]|nr:hypothetical protein [Acidimicrobiia bacterium]